MTPLTELEASPPSLPKASSNPPTAADGGQTLPAEGLQPLAQPKQPTAEAAPKALNEDSDDSELAPDAGAAPLEGSAEGLESKPASFSVPAPQSPNVGAQTLLQPALSSSPQGSVEIKASKGVTAPEPDAPIGAGLAPLQPLQGPTLSAQSFSRGAEIGQALQLAGQPVTEHTVEGVESLPPKAAISNFLALVPGFPSDSPQVRRQQVHGAYSADI